LLTGSPNVGWFASQGGFVEVPLSHARYYILHVFLACARIILYVESITERNEKWQPPLFCL
jgi:hypothetical protein